MIGNNLWCPIPETRAACSVQALERPSSIASQPGRGCGYGHGSERGRSKILAGHADNHRFAFASLLHEPPPHDPVLTRPPNLWSILILNQCRFRIKVDFYIGSYAPARHTRNRHRSVAEI